MDSPGNYTYYRLDISSNHSGGILQLAGWGMNAAKVAGTTRTPMVTLVGASPSRGYHIIPLAGFTGMRALKHAGQHTADGRGYAMNRLFNVKIPVGKNTRLSYNIFPELSGNDL